MSTSRRPLSAGVARVVITPPIGIRMLGYTVQEGPSQALLDELTATALVLASGEVKAVLIGVDLVFIQDPHNRRIRERIGRQLGIAADHVLINASHTHLGAMLPGWQTESGEQERLQERYLAFLEEALVGLAAMADRQQHPARIGAGKGTAHIGMNRRERLPDGRVIIGENPGGAVDRDVSVLRVDDLGGNTIATVMAAGAHTVVLGPKTLALSPDYVGPARQIVESATQAPSVFLQGAAGNINPACGIGAGGPAQYDDQKRMGAMLAGETLKVWAGIRTHNQRGPRRIVQSVATVSVWDYEPLPVESVEQFSVTARRLTLPLHPFPHRDAIERQLTERRQALEAARARGANQGELHVAQRLLEWAELVAQTAATGVNPVSKDLEMWALRLNDIGIVAVSGEPFAELSLAVKRQSPLPHTIFLGYSNGCIGYLPTPEAFAEGGMEVHESVRNYKLPAPLTPAWGPAIIDNALDMLRKLSGEC